ncbi:hypothetical protein O6H91_01G139800 [Diphasiastrum complanatum]|uniref:Uncharacterized protein n=1 Tax=Diphasiastrum complanatum TaxID=34168 RepID=A0ACC2EWQ5_DIPCM|nr:hypothetical protein O6H91_01G139800 [Diphasiastrum complanatum]
MDTVLFFKVGKFYELYELDAEIGHKELDWKITLSGVGKCRQVGVSESGIDEAVQKLVARGYKVGRMEQIETAAQAKALRGPKATIQRELMQVLTPSTLIDGNLRPEAIHLLALKEELSQGLDGKESCTYGFAFVDAAVGRFYVGSIRDTSSRSALGALLTQLAPQELLYELGGLSKETHRALQKYSPPAGLLPVMRTPLQPRSEFMDSDAAVKFMLSRGYFKHAFKATAECFEKSKESWPEALNVLPDKDLAASALGALSSHIQRLKSDGELLPNAELYPYEVYRGSLRLDGQTTTNLELLKNSANGSKSGSLLGYLDSCCTVFGKRLLHRWICHPLQNLEEINERLDAVDELILLPELTSTLRAGLRKLPDLERMIARIRGLAGSPNISFLPGTMVQRRLKLLCSATKGLQDACELLRCLKTCVDSEGHPKAHILREASAFLDGERVGPVFAEMMSIIDQNSSSTKETFQQKDDTEDGEHAGLLFHLLSMFIEHQMYWSSVVEIIARLDVLSSFVVTIHNSNGPTCRPKFVPDNPHPNQTSCINGGSLLNIKGLWHPFATGGMGGVIVPNDVQLGMADGSCKPRAMLVTGPNMGGKSTLLRATCLAIIMAQLGCYVPGESCIMSIVDIIFTRIGASDRIMSGESTFLVECTEAASILQHATSKSLVVLDELGRGTSTFDGYAIAYAVFRHLIETLDCRLLFATHYHPLTEEFSGSSFVSLQHMACSFEPPHTLMNAGRPNQPADTNDEWNKASDVGQSSCLFDKQLVFLYKLKAGACPRSYGLQVASLAGIPESIVVVAAKASEMIHSCLNKAFQAATDVNTELSHIQKQWLKSLITAGKLITFGRSSNRPLDCAEDAYDTFLCLWHEMRKL